MRLLEPWRTRLLWLSLALNLFAAAMIAAPLVMHRRMGGPPNFDMVVNRMARDLPPVDDAAFRAAMARERPWYDIGRTRLDEARADVARAVTREPYDPEAIRAALKAMQSQLRESTLRFDDSIVLAVGQLSHDGRAMLSANMQRRRP